MSHVCAHALVCIGIQFLESQHVFFDMILACMSKQVIADMLCN